MLLLCNALQIYMHYVHKVWNVSKFILRSFLFVDISVIEYFPPLANWLTAQNAQVHFRGDHIIMPTSEEPSAITAFHKE